jgi:hypothetical protein
VAIAKPWPSSAGRAAKPGLPRSLPSTRRSPRPRRLELSALLVAQDQRSALRTLLKYASAPFDLVAMLKSAVVARTADTITLQNGVAIAAYPCRPQAVRGLRARVCVADEMAFFRSSEGYPTDVEMLRALRPTLATTGGKLIILSSPYAQSGGALRPLSKALRPRRLPYARLAGERCGDEPNAACRLPRAHGAGRPRSVPERTKTRPSLMGSIARTQSMTMRSPERWPIATAKASLPPPDGSVKAE